MIKPTDADIGRRVRWLGRNFGALKSFGNGRATVVFEPPFPTSTTNRTLAIEFSDLFWADNVGVTMKAGDQEPDPKFPKLRRRRAAT